MGFIDDVINNLETNMVLPSTFTVDVLSANDITLCIRRTPSSPTTRYADRSRDDVVAFQILVKHTNHLNAINTIDAIVEHLEGLTNLPNDGPYQFINMEVYTLPLLVEKTDRGSYIYSALFQAIIYKQH